MSAHPIYITICWPSPFLNGYSHLPCLQSRSSVWFSPWCLQPVPQIYVVGTFQFLGYRQARRPVLASASAKTLRLLLTPLTSSVIGPGHPFPPPVNVPLSRHLACFQCTLPCYRCSCLLTSCLVTSCFPLFIPWTTMHVLHHFAAVDCPSCSSCSFLHREFHLLRPPYLVIFDSRLKPLSDPPHGPLSESFPR